MWAPTTGETCTRLHRNLEVIVKTCEIFKPFPWLFIRTDGLILQRRKLLQFYIFWPKIFRPLPFLLVSSTLGPRSRISKQCCHPSRALPPSAFALRNRILFPSSPGLTPWLQTEMTPLIPTRQGLVSILDHVWPLQLPQTDLYPSLSLLAICIHAAVALQPSFARGPAFKTFYPFSHQYIPEMPTFQPPNPIASLAPEYSSVAPKSLLRLYFMNFSFRRHGHFSNAVQSPSEPQVLSQLSPFPRTMSRPKRPPGEAHV